jgi:hypothetical protein
MTKSGANATFGAIWSARMYGDRTSSVFGDSPSTNPITIPSRQPRMKPTMISSVVIPVCQSSRSLASILRNSDQTFEGGGRTNSGTPAARGSHSHTARKTTSTATLAPSVPGVKPEALGAESPASRVPAVATTTATDWGSARASGRGASPFSTDSTELAICNSSALEGGARAGYCTNWLV